MTGSHSGTIDHGDGKPVRLPAPFDHLSVVYPFQWDRPNRVHIADARKGTGTVLSPEYARALSHAVVQALGEVVLTRDEAAAIAAAVRDRRGELRHRIAVNPTAAPVHRDELERIDALLERLTGPRP